MPPAEVSPASPTLAPVASSFVGFGIFIGSWAVVTTDLKHSLGLDDGTFGLLLAGALVASGLMNAVAGGLAERWGTGKLLSRGLVGWAALVSAVALAQPAWALGLALVLALSMCGVVDVAMNVAATAGLANQPGKLVRFHSFFNGGAMIGAALAGVLRNADVSWRWTMLLPVLIGLGNAVWCSRVHLPAGAAGEDHGFLHAVRAVKAEGLVLLALVFACGAMVEGGIDTWGVLVLREQLAIGALVGAVAYVAGQGVATASRAGLGPIAGRLGAARGVAVGGGLAATGLAMLALAPAAGAVIGLALAAAGISVCWPLLLAHASAGRERPGAVVGGVTAIGYFGFVVGPPVVGWLSHTLGLRHALLILAGAAAFVAVAPSRVAPRPPVTTPTAR